MKILLSHSIAPADGPVASRLKAVTAAYGIQLLLPERDEPEEPMAVLPTTRRAIKAADAVVVLATGGGRSLQHVNAELRLALHAKKPVVALVEHNVRRWEAAGVLDVRFDRHNPGAHEQTLLQVLGKIVTAKKRSAAKAKAELEAAAIGALMGIAVGFLVLGAVSLASEDNKAAAG